MAAARLGEMLVKAKIITEDQLKQALEEQSKSGGRLGYNLAKLNILEETEIVSFLSKQYGVPSINLAEFEVDSGILKLIPGKTAKKYQVVPISRTGGTLTLAMADPTNVFALDDIKFMTGYNVEPVVASETSIEDAIMKYYESGGFGTGKADIDAGDYSTSSIPLSRAPWKTLRSWMTRTTSFSASRWTRPSSSLSTGSSSGPTN